MTLEQKLERHCRFFQPLSAGEGGYLYVTAPQPDSKAVLTPPKDLEEYWLSTEYRLKKAEHVCNAVFHGQDAIQREFVNLGPGVFMHTDCSSYTDASDLIALAQKNWLKL